MERKGPLSLSAISFPVARRPGRIGTKMVVRPSLSCFSGIGVSARGAVARRRWMAGGMGTDGAGTATPAGPATTQTNPRSGRAPPGPMDAARSAAPNSGHRKRRRVGSRAMALIEVADRLQLVVV